MKKRRTFITAIAALTALSMGMAGFSGTVWADPEDPVDPPASPSASSPAGATAISGGYGNTSEDNTTFTFNKYLIFDKNARVPNTEFTFSIAPAGISTVHLTAQNVELYNGLTGVVFNDGDDTTANDDKATFTEGMTATAKNGGTPAEFTNNKGAGASIGITDDASEKYAVDSVTLDFSAVQFKEPGVYRYTVTETAPTGAYTAETETQRTLDVYVVDKETVKGGSTYTELEIEGYVLYDKVMTEAALNFDTDGAATGIGYNQSEVKSGNGKKSSGFVNSYETHNLTIGKEVSGNQASRDKYFAITVEISNATAGDKYTVAVEKGDEDTANGVFANADVNVVPNAATTVSGENVKSLTVENGGTVTKTFYLHDGQYITICGLGKGVSYKVTEAAENYTSTDGIEKLDAASRPLSSLDWDPASDGNDALADLTEGSIGGVDIHTGFTNSRSGAIPTGVILSVAAPATIGIVVVAGIIYLVAKRRKDDDNEE